MSEKEIWKDIPNYEGLYQVSNLGRVKSLKLDKERVLKPGLNSQGYHSVALYEDGVRKTNSVHRLVMLAFADESDLQVNHINGIKTDNRLENLEYCTNAENHRHAADIGLKAKGEKQGHSKLTEDQAKAIKYGHQGMTHRGIAKIYGIANTQVSAIRSGKTWKHI